MASAATMTGIHVSSGDELDSADNDQRLVDEELHDVMPQDTSHMLSVKNSGEQTKSSIFNAS